jgi:RimJ/RimL family protein N-acetyltransferase
VTLTLRTVWLLLTATSTRTSGAAAWRGPCSGAWPRRRGAEDAHRLSLQTEAGNPRALELYAKAGFERVGEALLHRFL